MQTSSVRSRISLFASQVLSHYVIPNIFEYSAITRVLARKGYIHQNDSSKVRLSQAKVEALKVQDLSIYCYAIMFEGRIIGYVKVIQ
jgi:hypothetical protein